ncbi:MAG: hypothetical protein HY422_02270 [Candidatus Komeilibacteria bacterium]|nr:hypothetical protein [Candidatus Komeilibacteria bacterium]
MATKPEKELARLRYELEDAELREQELRMRMGMLQTQFDKSQSNERDLLQKIGKLEQQLLSANESYSVSINDLAHAKDELQRDLERARIQLKAEMELRLRAEGAVTALQSIIQDSL